MGKVDYSALDTFLKFVNTNFSTKARRQTLLEVVSAAGDILISQAKKDLAAGKVLQTDTGFLAANIEKKLDVRKRGFGLFGTSVALNISVPWYGEYWENYKNFPKIIRPRVKKFLRWSKVRGQSKGPPWAYARFVIHRTAYPWLTTSLRDAESKILEKVKETGMKVKVSVKNK